MTLSTLVRFTEPIDPRKVWAVAVQLINAPGEYRYKVRRAGSDTVLTDASWPLNDQYCGESDQGADALLWMSYGHEGAPLVNDEEVPAPPVGYVEVDFNTAYGYRDEHDRGCGDLHASYIAALVAWSPVPIAWCEEYTGEWFTGLSELHRLGRVSS